MEKLCDQIRQRFADWIDDCHINNNEVTIEVSKQNLRLLCHALRDEEQFSFKMLIDVCGVDYSEYGKAQWDTTTSTSTGFSRGVEDVPEQEHEHKSRFQYAGRDRFAVVYHLLSLKHNQRLRLRCFATGEPPMMETVMDIWASANWFEREAFDLYGIIFNGHADLRRILTDYGFIGHPFRKDFPLSGHVEVRYDATQQRVVYEPVDIKPRVLVPKVIREMSQPIREDKVDA